MFQLDTFGNTSETRPDYPTYFDHQRTLNEHDKDVIKTGDSTNETTNENWMKMNECNQFGLNTNPINYGDLFSVQQIGNHISTNKYWL